MKLNNGRTTKPPTSIKVSDITSNQLLGVGNLNDNQLFWSDATEIEARVKKLYQTIPRAELPDPIYAPKLVPGWGKKDYMESLTDLVQQYNRGELPDGWLGMGGRFGTVVAPSLAQLKPNLLAMKGVHTTATPRDWPSLSLFPRGHPHPRQAL